ncbi:MAG: Crp/Fnr family transcriptional regulator [Ectothiorhodospiraceae bacterium]|nr:Crp/Fnr family transcriptional regulator [Ectothiorhodospiraceae bacterium]MCH8503944.1 Crp/Fnr family transcriptional regulator [Ectothiorhodospiraceae bacterium]
MISRSLLQTTPLLAVLPAEACSTIAERSRLQSLASGEVLFHQGDAAGRFYIVLSGMMKLFRTNPNGQEKVVHLTGPGETFAEAVMFMEVNAYPVTAQATTATELVSIPSDAYREALRASPEACFRLLADLSTRLHGRLRDIDQLTLQQATPRVIYYLLSQIPPDSTEPASIALKAPKQVLASRLSVTPETLSRILHGLADSGLISVKGRRIELPDPARLREQLGEHMIN